MQKEDNFRSKLIAAVAATDSAVLSYHMKQFIAN